MKHFLRTPQLGLVPIRLGASCRLGPGVCCSSHQTPDGGAALPHRTAWSAERGASGWNDTTMWTGVTPSAAEAQR